MTRRPLTRTCSFQLYFLTQTDKKKAEKKSNFVYSKRQLFHIYKIKNKSKIFFIYMPSWFISSYILIFFKQKKRKFFTFFSTSSAVPFFEEKGSTITILYASKLFAYKIFSRILVLVWKLNWEENFFHEWIFFNSKKEKKNSRKIYPRYTNDDIFFFYKFFYKIFSSILSLSLLCSHFLILYFIKKV